MNPFQLTVWPIATRGRTGPDARFCGDSLVLDCRGCRLTPVPHSDECIRCVLTAMCEAGGSERVVLRTGRDTEISGRAGRALRGVASIRSWSVPAEEPRGRCRVCPCSRASVIRTFWDGFPGDGMRNARRILAEEAPDNEGCASCVNATGRALDQVDSGIRGVLEGLSSRGGTSR